MQKRVTPECLDLIKKLLTVDRIKRLSGEQALKHIWFTNCLKKKEG